MMTTGLGLCVLGLLCLHSLVLGQDQKVGEVPPGVLVFCDDESVKLAVTSAMEKFNEQSTSGNKMAVYEILSASKSENSLGGVYSVQFSSRRIQCPLEESRRFGGCTYILNHLPTPCNATVYVTGPKAVVEQVNCLMEPPVVLERAPCLGCPEDINENAEDLKVPISVSITKFNSISNSTHRFVLNSVSYATRQVVAGFRYTLGFDMRKSTCSKAENTDPIELCNPDADDVELAHCNSTVDVAPWRHEVPDANIECGPGAHPFTFNFIRRRPPGWSPLRNIMRVIPPTNSPPISWQRPSTTVLTKEESSEEDGDTPSKSTSASKSPPAAATADPFHCPFKLWKKIGLVELSTSSRKASPEPPIMEGGFTDMDLLG